MPTQPLVSSATGQQASPEMIENFNNLKLRGRDALQEFLSRFTSSSNSTNEQSIKSYYDPIKRQKLITFKSTGTKVKTKTVTEDEKQYFTEILSVFDSRKLNLRYIIQWPVTYSISYSICDKDGDSRSSQKALFRNKLQLVVTCVS